MWLRLKGDGADDQSVAVVTQASVFLGSLTAILHVFRVFPSQPNAKMAIHGFLAALTVLLLLVSVAAGRFSSPVVGLLALAAAIGALAVSVAVYQNHEPLNEPALVALYTILQMGTLTLVLGAAGVGAFS